jgi:flagellar biosynthesis protein FlhF
MGQKVPEDWERADATQLVSMSMRAPTKSAFDPKAADLGFFFAQATPLNAEQIHA